MARPRKNPDAPATPNLHGMVSRNFTFTTALVRYADFAKNQIVEEEITLIGKLSERDFKREFEKAETVKVSTIEEITYSQKLIAMPIEQFLLNGKIVTDNN